MRHDARMDWRARARRTLRTLAALLRRRLLLSGLGIALAGVAFTWPARCLVSAFVTTDEVVIPVTAASAIVGAFVLAAVIDWILWADTTKERNRTNQALREWEHATGQVFGRVTSRGSARWWWRPLYLWWTDRAVPNRRGG